MAEQVVKDGRVILRNVATGALGSVPVDQLGKFENDPDFRIVDAAEYAEAQALAEAQTFRGQVETVGRGAAEAVGDLGQLASRVAGSNVGKVLLGANPLTAAPYWAMQGTQAALREGADVDLNDPGRGLPAQAAGLLGDGRESEQAYEERTKLLRQANPGAYAGGELGGNILAGLATGGVTATAGKGIAGGLVRSGMRQGVADALGTGAAMAVEGGIYGAATTEGQARAAGQTEGATAEQLLQGIGLGALLGGGLGVGMSGAGTGIRRLLSKLDEPPRPGGMAAPGTALETAAEGTEAAAPKYRIEHTDPWDLAGNPKRIPIEEPPAAGGAGKAAVEALPEDRLARFQSDLTSGDYDTISRYGAHKPTPEAIEGRALARERPKIIDEAVPKMVQGVDRLDDALNSVTDQVRRVQLKKEGVQKMLEGINTEKAISYGGGQIAYVLQRAETVRNLIPGSTWSKGMRERLDRFLEYTQKHWTASMKRPSAADTFIAADLIKREAQHVQKNLASIVTRSTDGNAVEAARKALEMFESDIQEPLRLSLENQNIWGKAGKAQKEINAAWKADIDVGTRFSKELQTTDGQKVWADGRQRYYADSAKVKSWLESAGTAEGATRQEMVRARLDSARQLLQKIDEYHGLSEDQRPVFDRAMQASKDLEKELARVDKTIGIANKIEALHAAERLAAPAYSGIGGRVVGTIAGALGAGPMGAVMGALGVLHRPGAAMGAADQIQALAKRLGTRMESRASGWVNTAGTPTKAPSGWVNTAGTPTKAPSAPGKVRTALVKAGAAATATGGTVQKIAVPASVSLFMGRSKSLDEAYERRSNQLIRAQQDPDALIDSVAKATGGLIDLNPSLAGALVQKTASAITFLRSKAPAGTLDPTPLMPGRKSIIPRAELLVFARVWSAVERPLSVIDDLERGMATPDQIEALKVVHPETYQAIRASVSNALLDVARKGGHVPIAMRQQLDLLLDLDGAGEPAFSQRVADIVHGTQAAQAKQAAGTQRKRPPNLTASSKLPQESWPSAHA